MLAHLPKGYCIMWAMGSRCSWHQPRTKVWSDRTLLSAFGFLLHPLLRLQFIFKLLVTQEQKWPISSSNKITSDVAQIRGKSAFLLGAVTSSDMGGPKKLNSSEEGNFSAVTDIKSGLTFTLEYITFHTRHGICDINFIDGKHIQGLNQLNIKQSRQRTLIMPKTVSCFWKHKTLPSTSHFFHARASLGWVNGKINSLHASMKWEGIFLVRPVPSLLLF